MSDETQSLTSKGMYIHYCMHEGCKEWGAFGFAGRYGVEWFCFEHRDDGKRTPK